MSMHLVRGMSSLNQKRRKGQKKNQRQVAAEASHEAWLKSMGVNSSKPTTDKRGERIKLNTIPDYKSKATVKTSNCIPENGNAKAQNKYTGNEIAGIVTTHKSNLMPIRKDNKTAAVDAASMRR